MKLKETWMCAKTGKQNVENVIIAVCFLGVHVGLEEGQGDGNGGTQNCSQLCRRALERHKY